MNNGKNKANLLAYFTSSLRRRAAQERPDDMRDTWGASEQGNVAISITNINVVAITELECEKHE